MTTDLAFTVFRIGFLVLLWLLVLEDEYASSRHAALTPQSDGWWIEDLSSRNGTFIDDERLSTPRQLKIGDIIRIGQTTLELVG